MLPLKDNVPTRTFPVVTVALIAINVVVFLWEISGTPLETDVVHYGYYPCEAQGPCVGVAEQRELGLVPSVFTSMFMHGGWFHIAGNMLFLWIFGNNVEDALGRVRYLLWYLAAGIAATVTQTVVTLWFGNTQAASVPNIGASGAIAGVLGAYFLLLPGAMVLTAIFLGFFFFIQEIPAIFYLGIWFVFQAWQGGWSVLHPEANGGVAFFAHVGGFAFGVLTVNLVKARSPLRPQY
ncbi:MAG TPA: rhomboid family intramembrane serine protease [Gaiellaceae bacterium]|nr:rhomboid family intramembrane serine protease [Gaiellaceae bacterium]